MGDLRRGSLLRKWEVSPPSSRLDTELQELAVSRVSGIYYAKCKFVTLIFHVS